MQYLTVYGPSGVGVFPGDRMFIPDNRMFFPDNLVFVFLTTLYFFPGLFFFIFFLASPPFVFPTLYPALLCTVLQ